MNEKQKAFKTIVDMIASKPVGVVDAYEAYTGHTRRMNRENIEQAKAVHLVAQSMLDEAVKNKEKAKAEEVRKILVKTTANLEEAMEKVFF